MTDRVERKWAKFEADGPETVIKNLSRNVYRPETAELARSWLAQQERARNDASNLEQIRIARSAKNAAWAAAIAAIIAAISAVIAVFSS